MSLAILMLTTKMFKEIIGDLHSKNSLDNKERIKDKRESKREKKGSKNREIRLSKIS